VQDMTFSFFISFPILPFDIMLVSPILFYITVGLYRPTVRTLWYFLDGVAIFFAWTSIIIIQSSFYIRAVQSRERQIQTWLRDPVLRS
jgi:hypothetical protein